MESLSVGMKLVDAIPKLIAASLALVALASGILAHVDPIACVGRAVLGFVLGKLCYQVWYALGACHISVPTLRVEAGGRVAEESAEQNAA